MRVLQFWFDFGSPYSYLAAVRIQALAHDAGVAVEWRPFLLGAIFKEQGWNDSPFNLFPAKGRYMWRDLDRTSAALSIPLVRPSRFPRNGLLAARIACWFAAEPWVPAFTQSVFRANFAEDREISDSDVVATCLNCLYLDAPLLIEQAQTEASKLKLRAQTDDAKRRGIFGAPSFVIGEEMFWGNDRLGDALAWAQSH